MITDLLGKHVQTAERAEDWKDAIRMAAAPLLENGSISQTAEKRRFMQSRCES